METANIRYIVDDVDEALAFYTQHLGFNVDMHPAPGFAALSRGPLRLLLNTPGAGGAGAAMTDGEMPEAGGWNRIQIEVDGLAKLHARLENAGLRFRSDITQGQGGAQTLLQDPSGNLVELFEPKSDRKVRAIPDGYRTVTPFLTVDDVPELLSFVTKAFSGKTEYKMTSEDGVVRHATIRVGDSLLMISSGTGVYGSMPCMLHLYVEDADAQYAQALDAGGVSLQVPRNEFYGDRTAAVADRWKNQWWIATHVEDVDPQELQKREAEFREERGL